MVIIPFYLPFLLVDLFVSDRFRSVYQTQALEHELVAVVLFLSCLFPVYDAIMLRPPRVNGRSS